MCPHRWCVMCKVACAVAYGKTQKAASNGIDVYYRLRFDKTKQIFC